MPLEWGKEFGTNAPAPRAERVVDSFALLSVQTRAEMSSKSP